jgi:hypothetical protein
MMPLCCVCRIISNNIQRRTHSRENRMVCTNTTAESKLETKSNQSIPIKRLCHTTSLSPGVESSFSQNVSISPDTQPSLNTTHRHTAQGT